jgi:hypothetical protein
MFTIKVHNLAQQILMTCELQGQISDGFWENARPHSHWEIVSNANVVIDPENVGCDFQVSRNYNFANSELLEIVGDRMIAFVKAKMAFPHLDLENHWDWDISDDDLRNPIGAREMENVSKIITLFGADVDTIIAKISLIRYSHAELVKDLKALGKIIRGR